MYFFYIYVIRFKIEYIRLLLFIGRWHIIYYNQSTLVVSGHLSIIL